MLSNIGWPSSTYWEMRFVEFSHFYLLNMQKNINLNCYAHKKCSLCVLYNFTNFTEVLTPQKVQLSWKLLERSHNS